MTQASKYAHFNFFPQQRSEAPDLNLKLTQKRAFSSFYAFSGTYLHHPPYRDWPTAAMQGFNMGRYVPPELEGRVSANTAAGKGHALGNRARKLRTEGIMTVRFELPFAVWCGHCSPEQVIGQGVRFNAEKKRVGEYYSTAVWSFRFKHTVCGGWLEIRTDPRAAEYVVVEGGRRRDYGGPLEGEVGVSERSTAVTEEEKDRLEKEGGFARVEKAVGEKKVLLGHAERLEELRKRSERDWEDPYEMSRRLRRGFRVGREERKEAEVKGQKLSEKFSLGVELLEEREEDAQRAKLVDFGTGEHGERGEIKPMFVSEETSTTNTTLIPPERRDGGKRGREKEEAEEKMKNMKKKKKKKNAMPSPAELALQRKVALQNRLTGNTKASIDPFLNDEEIWQPKTRRKQTEKVEEKATKARPAGVMMGLVDYDSDSS